MHGAAALLAMCVLATAGWRGPAGAFLDAYRSTSVAGRSSPGELRQLQALRVAAAKTAAPERELRDALAARDPRTAALAVAHLAAVDEVDARLASLVLTRLPREPDPAVRQLALLVLKAAGREWARSRGPEIAAALVQERNPSVATVAALSLLPLLEPRDQIQSVAALASNGNDVRHAVLYSTVHLRGGGPGLAALADRLRRDGRADVAAEVERFRAESERGGGGG